MPMMEAAMAKLHISGSGLDLVKMQFRFTAVMVI